MKCRNLLVMAVTAVVLLPPAASAAPAAADLATKRGEERPSAWQPGEPCEPCIMCLNPPCLMAEPLLAPVLARPAPAGAEHPRQNRSWPSRAWRLASRYIVPGIVAGVIVAAASR